MVGTPMRGAPLPPGPPGSAGSGASIPGGFLPIHPPPEWGHHGSLREMQASMQPLVDALAQDKNTLEQLHLEGQLENAQLRKQVQELAEAFQTALSGNNCSRCENLQREVEAGRAEYLRVREELEDLGTVADAHRLRSELLAQDTEVLKREKNAIEQQLYTGKTDLSTERAFMVTELEMFKRQVMQLEAERSREISLREAAESRVAAFLEEKSVQSGNNMEVSRYEQENKSLHAALDGQKKSYANIEEELKNMSTELKNLRASPPTAAPVPHSDYHKELLTVKTQRDALGAELTSLKQQLAALSDQIREMEKSRMVLFKETTIAKEEAKAAVAAKAEAVREVAVLQERVAAKERNEQDLILHTKTLHKKLEDTFSAKEEAAVLKDRLSNSTSQLNHDLANKNQLIDSLRMQISVVESQMEATTSDVHSSKAESLHLQDRLDTLTAEHDVCIKRLHDHDELNKIEVAKMRQELETEVQTVKQLLLDKERMLQEERERAEAALTSSRRQSQVRFQEQEEETVALRQTLEAEIQAAKKLLTEREQELTSEHEKKEKVILERKVLEEEKDKAQQAMATIKQELEAEIQAARNHLFEKEQELDAEREKAEQAVLGSRRQSQLLVQEEREKARELEQKLQKEAVALRQKLEAERDAAKQLVIEKERELEAEREQAEEKILGNRRQSQLLVQEEKEKAQQAASAIAKLETERDTAKQLLLEKENSLEAEREKAEQAVLGSRRQSQLLVQEEREKAQKEVAEIRRDLEAEINTAKNRLIEKERELDAEREKAEQTVLGSRRQSQLLVQEEREKARELEQKLQKEAVALRQTLEAERDAAKQLVIEKERELEAEREQAEEKILGSRRQSQLLVQEEKEKALQQAAKLRQDLEAEIQAAKTRLSEKEKELDAEREKSKQAVLGSRRQSQLLVQEERERTHEATSVIKTLEAERDSARDLVLEKERERETADDTISNYKQLLQEEREKARQVAEMVRSLEAERDGVRQLLTQRDEVILQIRAELQTGESRAQLKEQEAVLIRKTLSEKEEAIAQAHQREQEADVTVKSLTAERNTARELLSEKEETMARLESDLVAVNIARENDRRAAEKERGMLHEKISVLEGAKLTLTEATNKIDVFEMKCTAQENELASINKQLREAQLAHATQLSTIKETLRASNEETATLQGTCEALRTNLKSKDSELSQIQTSLQDQTTARIKERAALEGKVQTLSLQMSAAGPSVVDALKDDIVVLVTDRDRQEQKVLKLEWEKAETRKALEESEQRLEAASKQTSHAEAELRKKVAELEKEVQDSNSIEPQLQQLQSQKTVLDENYSKLRDDANLFSDEVNRLRDEKVRVEAERDAFRREVVVMKDEIDVGMRRVEHLQNELSDARAHMVAAQADTHNTVVQHTALECELKKEAVDLRVTLSGMEGELQVEREKSVCYHAELKGMMDDAAGLGGELEHWKARALQAEGYRQAALTSSLGHAELQSISDKLRSVTPLPTKDQFLSKIESPHTAATIPTSTIAFVSECLRTALDDTPGPVLASVPIPALAQQSTSAAKYLHTGPASLAASTPVHLPSPSQSIKSSPYLGRAASPFKLIRT